MSRNDDGGRTIGSDETLFTLIELLSTSDDIGVTELAEATGKAKSTVHGHLATMREHGYVVREDGRYRLGLRWFERGQGVRIARDIYTAASPVVDRLAVETGETVWLLTHENGRVMYLDGRAEAAEINVDALIGSWAKMHVTSGGKAILAHLSDERVDEIIDEHGLPAMTDSTITDRETLDAERETIRERGYALNLGEDLRGIHAIAVPLISEGTVEGALAIAGPAHRVDRERCTNELADDLLAAADDIELSLAYR